MEAIGWPEAFQNIGIVFGIALIIWALFK